MIEGPPVRSWADFDSSTPASPTCVVADDDPLLLAYLAAVFRARGYEVLTAKTGREALRLVRERNPAFVLLDMMMPDLDGRQVLWAIRQATSTREIPVLMLTARKGESCILQSFDLGADDYVTKPVLADELVDRVERVLAAKH